MEIQNQTAKFLDPEAIIAQLEIPQGCTVADFGCGPGFFSIPFAEKIGEYGKVFSFDVLPQALEAVQSKAKNLGLMNLSPQRVNLEKVGGSKLDDESVDWIVLKDMLFQNQQKELIIGEAKRILKPEGKILVIEWNETPSAIGPDMALRIPRKKLEQMLNDCGLAIESEINAGDFHYSFIVRKNVF